MGEAHGEGVGLIRGGVVAQTKEGTGHKSDLLFFGGPFAGGGFFDELGRIFVNGEAASSSGEKGGTAGGPKDDGGAGVLDIDDQFDGQGGGRVLGDDFGEAVVNFEQAILGWARGGIFNRAGGKDSGFFGRALENGVTSGTKGGVESENAHGESVPNRVGLSREGSGVGLTRKK